MHRVYLSLGSNIRPEVNLPKAIELLQEYGEIPRVSKAWESEAVGSDGPNFLNACALLLTPLSPPEIKEKLVQPIEAKLGRQRSPDKNAPRTIDIDVVLFDDQLLDDKYWKQAFVVVPLAEIYPTYRNPAKQEDITETARHLRQNVWMETRPGVFPQFNGAGSGP